MEKLHFLPKKTLTSLLALAIFCIFIALTTYYINTYHNASLSGDSRFYYTTAKNLARGAGYTHDGKVPSYSYGMGYPLFLSAVFSICGDSINSVIAGDLILHLLIMALMYKLTSFYVENVTMRFIPLLFYVMNYKIVSLVTGIMPGLLSIFLLLAAFAFIKLFFVKKRSVFFILFSLSLSCLALVKPEFQYLIAVFAVYFVFFPVKRKIMRWSHVMLFLVLATAIIAPVMIRNYNITGFYRLNFHSGDVMCITTSRGGFSLNTLHEDDEDLYKQIKGKNLAEQDDILRKKALDNIIHNGIAGIPLYVRSLSVSLFAFPEHSPDNSFSALGLKRKIYMALNIIALLLSFAATILILKSGLKDDGYLQMLLLSLMFLMSLGLLAGSVPRHGYRTLILLYLLSPLGVEYIRRKKWLSRKVINQKRLHRRDST